MRRWWPLFAPLLCACGDQGVEAPADAAADAAEVADTASVAETGDAPTADTADAAKGPLCPDAPPRAGDPCARPPIPSFADPIPGSGIDRYSCAYGDDPHGVCLTYATCDHVDASGNGTWTVTPPPDGCGTTAPTCPATFGDREGTACDATAASKPCDYAEGRCDCEPCSGDAGPVVGGYWHCIAWTTAPAGCPVDRPRIGSECVDEGKICDYSDCCLGPFVGADMACVEGNWWATFSTACSCRYRACP